jgi:hypothetical protein
MSDDYIRWIEGDYEQLQNKPPTGGRGLSPKIKAFRLILCYLQFSPKRWSRRKKMAKLFVIEHFSSTLSEMARQHIIDMAPNGEAAYRLSREMLELRERLGRDLVPEMIIPEGKRYRKGYEQ